MERQQSPEERPRLKKLRAANVQRKAKAAAKLAASAALQRQGDRPATAPGADGEPGLEDEEERDE